MKIKGIRGYEHNPESAAFNSTLNSNLNSEIAKVVEYLSVLARTVKALQSNQLNFNISVSGLIDYFQRIYSTTTKVKKYLTEMNDNLKIVTNYKIKFSLISFWNNIIIFF